MPDAPSSHIQSRFVPSNARVDTKLSLQGGGQLGSITISLVNDQDPGGFAYYGTDMFGERGWYGTFVPSGPQHAAGLVPDPGVVAGTTRYLCEDGLWKVVVSGGGGGSGSSMSNQVTQTTHGLSVGNVVRWAGSSYVKALADTGDNAEVVGIVSVVTDADTFTLTTGGQVTGLSGLTSASVYFLSTSTAGLLTTIAPSVTGQISKPLLIATSSSGGYWFNWRGWTVGTPVGGGGGGGGPAVWGTITGTLSAQTDLQSALNGKQPLDSNLTYIAGQALVTFGLGFLTLTDEPTARAYIGAGTSNFDGTFIALSGKPTTIAGYGITDAQPLDADLTAIAALATTSFGRSVLIQPDAATTRTYIGAGTSSFDGTYASLTGKPTTLSGYGITDAYTKSAADAAFAPISHTHTFASLTSKPTTLSGYGITDAEPALGNPSSTGYVLSSTATGVRSWIVPATGGGSPGGSATQVQFNNSGAFGGMSGVTWDSSNAILTLNNTGGTVAPLYAQLVIKGVGATPGASMAFESSYASTTQDWYFGSGTGGPINNNFRIADLTNGADVLNIQTGTGHAIAIFGELGWTSTGSAGGTIDTGIIRNAAGIVEINNGTAGTYRDLTLRNITISGTITGPTTLLGYGIADAYTKTAADAAFQPLDADLTSIAALVTTSFGRSFLTQADATASRTYIGLGSVTNDAQIKASDFPTSSVDGEISLFSGTTGKSQKRATGTGLVTATAGVYGTVTANSSAVGLGNVTNDAQIKASDFPSTSVDGEISLFSGTTGKAHKRATGSGVVIATSGVFSTLSAGTVGNQMVSDGTTWVSVANVPQNTQNAVYTFAAADSGKHIFHDEVTARTYTIPNNATTAFPVGTAITIVNNTGGGTITLAIQATDVLRRGDGTAGTGSRTIAADSVATILKTKSTEWFITGKFT